MNQTLHIIAKDARHLRWGFVGWTMIVAAYVVFTVARPSLELDGEAVAFVAAQLVSLTSFIKLVMMGLIVSWLVHDDPPVGLDAFWLTRPIDYRKLMTAKLAVVGAFLVVLPFVGELVVMAASRVGARDMWRAAPAILLPQMAAALLLTAAASLTPSITRYAIVIIGAAGAFVLLVGAVLAGALLFVTETSSSPRPEVVDSTPAIVGDAWTVGVSLWVVLYQYRHRRPRRAATFAGVGLVMAIAVPIFWPWQPAREPDLDPGGWAHDETHAAVVFDGQPPDVSDEMMFGRRGSARKRIAASVRLTGVPDDISLRSVEVRSRLEIPGATLLSTQNESVSVRRAGTLGATPDRLRRLQVTLGVTRLLGQELEPEYQMWPVLLIIPDHDFARYAHTAGRLTASLDFHFERPAVAETVGLEPGQTFSESNRRIEIVRVDRRVDSCTVLLREISINSMSRARVHEPEQFLLRNARRGEAVRGDQEWITQNTDSMLLQFLLSITIGRFEGVSVSDGNGFNGFAVRTYGIRYPSRTSSASTRPVIDAAWLESAELARVVTHYAGHVPRSLTIDDFKMAE